MGKAIKLNKIQIEFLNEMNQHTYDVEVNGFANGEVLFTFRFIKDKLVFKSITWKKFKVYQHNLIRDARRKFSQHIKDHRIKDVKKHGVIFAYFKI